MNLHEPYRIDRRPVASINAWIMVTDQGTFVMEAHASPNCGRIEALGIP
jgi:hypothetical protein